MKNMTLQELLQWVDLEYQRSQERYFNFPDQDKVILARSAKLTEEVGELCDKILAKIGAQRPDKVSAYSETDLQDEFADVLLVTLLLAKAAGVDIEQALSSKIPKVDARYKS